jgi:hypothetical protein
MMPYAHYEQCLKYTRRTLKADRLARNQSKWLSQEAIRLAEKPKTPRLEPRRLASKTGRR